jgi:predicted RNA-binding protein with PUA-like domain
VVRQASEEREARMAHWLVKSEPHKYSFEQLQKDGKTVWDGVRNNTAALHLKAMKIGDEVFFYHSNEGLDVVGIAKVVKESFIDPTDASGRFVAVELAPVRPVKTPVTLAQMKANPKLANMAMLRLFRISVSPVTDDEWAEILKMAGE